MPTKKLNDKTSYDFLASCRHPDHDIPTMIVYTPGTYEHVCAGCGVKTYFTVDKTFNLLKG